ncbi:hypothetical protein [Rathayibacter sp. SD072]|uniref:hypothetical protein n=1 Tax=Rathayibacter sp. SD072 TaxID=2781731 RepID=UPI001A965334|nr:hypothetical protein [Rathayibacter sp. SD072]MBO0983456.1 hypothetical protein [Rathayibacter sp. SD072]
MRDRTRGVGGRWCHPRMVLLDVEARPAGGGPSVRECFDDALVAAVRAACAVDAFRARAEAQRAELIELARRTAMTLPDALVDPSVQAHVEREEAAMRALIAEIATGMRVSESWLLSSWRRAGCSSTSCRRR